MKVILLAGGLGTRLAEETKKVPKPLVKIGAYPILIHIMNIFDYYGYNNFVICAGYKSNEIIKYFKNLLDFKLVKTKKNQNIFYSKQKKWMINIFYTGNKVILVRLLKIKNFQKQ